MGATLVAGWIRAGMDPDSLAIAEKDPERRADLERILPGVTIGNGVSDAEGVVLAVKPTDAEQAGELARRSGARRVLSIMAGVRIAAIESWIDSGASGASVLRAMPNTPALVGAGVSALAAGAHASEEDFQWAETLLRAVGEVVRVGEEDLDTVTGLSGSGPAYVFKVVEMLAQAGARGGLPVETSRVLARQTVVGAGKLLAESEEEPETLRAEVTSPGGTTEAGLAVLEAHGVADAFYEAVAAASARSKQLGDAH